MVNLNRRVVRLEEATAAATTARLTAFWRGDLQASELSDAELTSVIEWAIATMPTDEAQAILSDFAQENGLEP